MDRSSRRDFLARVGGGALAVSLGPALAAELGLLPRAWADEGPEVVTFGPREPLVAFMAETPLDQLLPALVAKLRAGTTLEDLVAAGALANARAFGGEDYMGFHTMAALAPAYRIALELPEAARPLPVLKVLYRNTRRIQELGAAKKTLTRPRAGEATPAALRDAVRAKDADGAERVFSGLASGSAAETLDRLLPLVEEVTDVHNVVVPARAYDLVELLGQEHAWVLLRQSVHYGLVRGTGSNLPERYRRSREFLPRLLAEHHLEGGAAGNAKKLDDTAALALGRTIFGAADPLDAAHAAAAALASGVAPDQVGEAISIAANQLVLRDHGRRAHEVQAGKPLGSVHGDSIGVHGADSANAWRKLARAAGPRNAAACLILGAYQVAFDRADRGGDFLTWEPCPSGEALEKVKAKEPAELVLALDAAIRANDQAAAAAIVHRSGELGHAPAPIVDVLRRYAVSEDGALHAEKYFRTVTEEMAANRPAFQMRHLVALARVTASECGQPAPGVEEARRLLGS
jgi:hypothetical protein